MTSDTLSVADSGEGRSPSRLPPHWLHRLSDQLEADERIAAWLVIDLDPALRFSEGLLVQTDRRLLACQAGESQWQVWTLREGLELLHTDYAGVGSLELRGGGARLGLWRYTLTHNILALRLIEAFEQAQANLCSGAAQRPPSVAACPNCKTPARTRAGGVPDLHPRAADSAFDLDPVPALAFR